MTFVAQSATMTYAELAAKNYIDTGSSISIPSIENAWHGTPYAVPEPTSAMLVMVGFGLMALKRKERKEV